LANERELLNNALIACLRGPVGEKQRALDAITDFIRTAARENHYQVPVVHCPVAPGEHVIATIEGVPLYECDLRPDADVRDTLTRRLKLHGSQEGIPARVIFECLDDLQDPSERQRMNRRICFFGGPSSGKSTIAAKVFAELKSQHRPFELVDEAIKRMAWQKIAPKGWDSVWLFGKQIHHEDIVLRSGGCVVTGGPPLQQIVYMKFRAEPCWRDLMNVAQKFETEYPAVNILLRRNVPYQTEGRYEATEDHAARIDRDTVDLLKEARVSYNQFVPQQFTEIMAHIMKLI